MKENNSLFSNKEKLAENKLIILYILQNVSCALSNSQLLRLLYDFDDFNYYYFQQLLSELVEQKYIMNYKQDEEWLYKITPLGAEVLSLTENIMPGITKYKLDIIIHNLVKETKNDISVIAEYVPSENDSYITKCKIVESHKTTFEISIFCTTQEQAKAIADNWQTNAATLYPQFIDLLTECTNNNE